jgi:hypothetical protein
LLKTRFPRKKLQGFEYYTPDFIPSIFCHISEVQEDGTTIKRKCTKEEQEARKPLIEIALYELGIFRVNNEQRQERFGKSDNLKQRKEVQRAKNKNLQD